MAGEFGKDRTLGPELPAWRSVKVEREVGTRIAVSEGLATVGAVAVLLCCTGPRRLLWTLESGCSATQMS